MFDKLKLPWDRMTVTLEETLTFDSIPSEINVIEDGSGRTFIVQAPALRLLKPGEAQEVRLRFVAKDHTGCFSGFGDGPVRRRIVRRDCGVVPLYFFD